MFLPKWYESEIQYVIIPYFFVILHPPSSALTPSNNVWLYFSALYKIMENDLEESFPVMGRNNARPSRTSVISFINYVIYWNVHPF